jgi:hypothetical protein
MSPAVQIRPLAFLSLIVSLLVAVPGLARVQTPDRLAVVHQDPSALVFEPAVDYGRMTLTVSGPAGDLVQRFDAGEPIVLHLADLADLADPVDGSYSWELRREAVLDPAVSAALAAAREASSDTEALESLAKAGRLPTGPFVQTGAFTVVDGRLVGPGDGPPETDPATLARADGSDVTHKAVLTNANGVIRSSLCVGFSCVDAPDFDDSTILLEEDNTRIKFSDVSDNASYPRNDWEIEANSNQNGGLSYLAFHDCGPDDPEGGCADDPVFGVQAGTRSYSLWVDASGEVGIGTSTPLADLHVTVGDSPTLRLEQNTASGFQAQTWDVAGNETSFFVRDSTNGSTLPFRIRPGAPNNALVVDTDGQVGVGLLSPTEMIHVQESANVNTLIVAENTSDGTAAAGVLRARSNAATVNFQAHGNGRTLSRFGEPLAGWAEFLQVNGNGLIIGTFGDTPLILGTARNNVLEITPGGSLLHRGATIHADYVFEPGYELPSIGEQTDYMWSNKHLPAIGAARVGDDGREVVELGSDRQAIVEELEKAHIYIGQLHERLERMERTIEELTAER